MAAPVAAFVQLPTDSGNTGKKVQTQTEVIGADTVHAHFYVPRSRRKVVGRFKFAHALQSVQASAQNGTSTAFWWLEMPTGATVHGRLKRLHIEHGCVGEADMLTIPRIVLARFTFTGTASGATVTPCKSQSGLAANVANMRTAVTGMTVAVGAAAFCTAAPVLALTTSGMTYGAGPVAEWIPEDEEEFLHFDAGEGYLLYQPDAGTASDTRRFVVSGTWDEFDDT